VILPAARGSLSETLFALLPTMRPGEELRPMPAGADDVADEQISLWALYELHYRGFEDVSDQLEWDPSLLTLRRGLELTFEDRLRRRFLRAEASSQIAGDLATELFAYVEAHPGRSVAAYVQRNADRDQVLELLRVRSLYHLKEADPTSWAVPRLPRAAQAGLVELLYDEYGAGRPAAVHSGLFARAMAACDLDGTYGAYVDDAPTEALEQNNAMSLFGLHRRLRGAALGHLAAFEATSSLPSRRMAQGLARLELPDEVVAYYTEHVEADAVHEQLAVRSICAPLVAEDPSTARDVYFGAFSCLDLEDRLATRLLETWEAA
jgi:heme oxygenase-like protein